MQRNVVIIMVLLFLYGCISAYKEPPRSGYYGKVKLDKGELELLRKKDGFLFQNIFKVFS